MGFGPELQDQRPSLVTAFVRPAFLCQGQKVRTSFAVWRLRRLTKNSVSHQTLPKHWGCARGLPSRFMRPAFLTCLWPGPLLLSVLAPGSPARLVRLFNSPITPTTLHEFVTLGRESVAFRRAPARRVELAKEWVLADGHS